MNFEKTFRTGRRSQLQVGLARMRSFSYRLELALISNHLLKSVEDIRVDMIDKIGYAR